MKYKRADSIFPKQLTREMQKYIQGEMVYIPSVEGARKGWGEKSGHKTCLRNRNHEIRSKFGEGLPIDQLAAVYCLSPDSIKKIVYTKLSKS